jgi:uncharacterized protein (UPF0218 family)/phosphopantetheine adenylyltransferase
LAESKEPVAVVTDSELMGKDLELMSIIQPAEYRLKKLGEYLQSIQPENEIKLDILSSFEDLVKLKGTLEFLMYQGPCCTEIESGALELRKNTGGHDDKIEYLKPVRADDGDKLTSARIRMGTIDRNGKRLAGTSEPARYLKLEGRTDLKAPKGDVYHVKDGPPEKRVVKRILDEKPSCVIAVGDVTSDTVIQEGFTPEVSIIDGITKRGEYRGTITGEREYLCYNPAAVLYPEAWSTIKTAIDDGLKSVVYIDGEEDLMGFPAVLLAPDDSVMIYGQPDIGIVWVPINSSNKELARDLLEKMPVIR